MELQALASSQAYLATNSWPNIEEAMCPVCRDGIPPIQQSPTRSELDMIATDDTEDTVIELHSNMMTTEDTGVGFSRLSLATTTSSSVAASRFN